MTDGVGRRAAAPSVTAFDASDFDRLEQVLVET